jgi:hypothetical protein
MDARAHPRARSHRAHTREHARRTPRHVGSAATTRMNAVRCGAFEVNTTVSCEALARELECGHPSPTHTLAHTPSTHVRRHTQARTRARAQHTHCSRSRESLTRSCMPSAPPRCGAAPPPAASTCDMSCGIFPATPANTALRRPYLRCNAPQRCCNAPQHCCDMPQHCCNAPYLRCAGRNNNI